MNDQNRNHDTLKKMVEYCKDAESFTERCGYDFENYKSDTMFQYACNMCIMQIGELVHRLSDEFIEKKSPNSLARNSSNAKPLRSRIRKDRLKNRLGNLDKTHTGTS